MARTGQDFAHEIRSEGIIVLKTYKDWILRQVLPSLKNLEKRAEEIADEYYERVASQPAGEDEGVDSADAADAANYQGSVWYERMRQLRQAMLNLFAAGLFHIAEQQLADLCYDASFADVEPPRDTKLEVIADWYRDHFKLKLKGLRSWLTVAELRLVANVVKHGEGSAAKKLRKVRPELFVDRTYADIDEGVREQIQSPRMSRVRTPLSGDDLYVSEEDLESYANSAISFLNEIAEYFEANASTWYPQ